MSEPKVFVTSDLHFFHKNILKFNPHTRPYKYVDEMNDALIENWNNVVGPDDDVYDLGDISFSSFSKMLPLLLKLNGRHHLIRGNHDNPLQKEKNIEEALRLGALYSVNDYLEIKHNGKKVIMCHYAFRVWNKSHHGSFMLYGHSHGSLEGIGRSMDVGIDACEMESNGAPFLLDDVLEYLETKPIHRVDHHTSTTG